LINGIALLSDINFQEIPKVDTELKELLLKKIVIANLEGYVDDVPRNNTLGMTEDSIKKMRELLNIRFINLANNHTLDGDKKSFRRTEEVLQNEGITSFGTRERPYVTFENSGKKIGVLAFAWRFTGAKSRVLNLCWISLKEIIKQVSKLKSEVEYLIVYPHWGVDLEILPTPWQVAAANRIIAAGANLIVGHHSHTIQPAMKSVYFSIGNTYMPKNEVTSYHSGRSSNGLIIEVDTGNDNSVSSRMTRSSPDSIYLQGDSGNCNSELDPSLTNNLKRYCEFFRSKRIKRTIPVFCGNALDYFFRVPYVLLLESFVSTGLVKKWLRNRRRT